MRTPLRLRDRVIGEATVEVAFTGAGCDVSDHAAAEVRRAALGRIAEEAGAQPVLMRQVHGATVVLVDDPPPTSPPECDALVTGRPGVALVARAADCVPVLLADTTRGVIAAVHAGRPGLAAGIVPATLARLRDLGAVDLHAWIGPHVCGDCYEVPADLREQVAARVPETWSTTGWGTPALDLGAGVRAQLAAAGAAVREVGPCTREDPDWPSYRRDGAAATRFAAVIWRSR